MRRWIDFKNCHMAHLDFARLLRDMTEGKIDTCTCSCEYKQAHRLILKGYGNRLTYYLKYEVSEKMTPQDCVKNLIETCDREWGTTTPLVNKWSSNIIFYLK